jgi:hypothetical protein
MKSDLKQNDFRLVTEMPKEAGQIVAMCQFQNIVLVATSTGLFAAGDPAAVDKFVKNFSIRGKLPDPKKQPA